MDATFGVLQELAPPTWVRVLLIVVVLGMVAYDALVGRRDYRAFLAALAADRGATEATRTRMFYRWARMGWAAAIATLLAVWVLPGLDPADLGLRRPHFTGLAAWFGGASSGAMAGAIVGALVGVVLSVVVYWILARRSGRPAGPGMVRVAPMLPTGGRDRRAWTALAVTAGVTEEITYRGLALLAVAVALPVGQVPAVVIVAVLFGLAHTYQGVTGMLATGVVGAALSGLYLATGSLLLSMLLHVILDLRALLLTPSRPAAPQAHEPATV